MTIKYCIFYDKADNCLHLKQQINSILLFIVTVGDGYRHKTCESNSLVYILLCVT